VKHFNLHNNYEVTKYLQISGLSVLPQRQAPSYPRFFNQATQLGAKIVITRGGGIPVLR
jgi:hypothetical protein